MAFFLRFSDLFSFNHFWKFHMHPALCPFLLQPARVKASCVTLEANVANLNVKKFDLEFDIDPLFRKVWADIYIYVCMFAYVMVFIFLHTLTILVRMRVSTCLQGSSTWKQRPSFLLWVCTKILVCLIMPYLRETAAVSQEFLRSYLDKRCLWWGGCQRPVIESLECARRLPPTLWFRRLKRSSSFQPETVTRFNAVWFLG